MLIVDEAQNALIPQTKTVLTRLGMNSRMVITGDPSQVDLISEKSGLLDLIQRIERRTDIEKSGIKLIKLANEDIKRSKIVQYVIDMYK